MAGETWYSVINHITSFHRQTPPANATMWHNHLNLLLFY